ncbi:MAG: SIMPL domain-containing protein [Janthinobacterium lividum]
MHITKYLVIMLLGTVAPAGYSQTLDNPAAVSSSPHLTAQGHAEIKTKADVANLTISVKVASRIETVAAQQNAARTTVLVAKIKALPGVRSEDIQTAGYTVTRPFSDASVPVLLGYLVTNTVQVTLRNVSEVSRLIDLTAGTGATRITGLTYTLADRQAAEQRALTLAAANARERAQTMASALGMTLGRLRVVSDSGSGNVVYANFGNEASNDLTSAGSLSSTPISPQLVIVRADVAVDYSLDPSPTP